LFSRFHPSPGSFPRCRCRRAGATPCFLFTLPPAPFPRSFPRRAGADPTKLIEDLAKRKKIRTLGVSLGQGQEVAARRHVAAAAAEGAWVLLQNAHLGLGYLQEVGWCVCVCVWRGCTAKLALLVLLGCGRSRGSGGCGSGDGQAAYRGESIPPPLRGPGRDC
jgi:hypothetical protein